MAKRPRINEAVWSEAKQHWRIDVQRDARRRSFYSPTPGKKGKIEAERKADTWLESQKTDSIRLEQAFAGFLEQTLLLTSRSTHEQREALGRRWILPTLRLRKLASITSQDWQDCINAAYRKGLSKKSCENIRGVITAFARYARKANYAMIRPEDLEIPRDAPIGTRRVLQPDALRMLFTVDTLPAWGKAAPCWYIYAWRFSVVMGLRPGELAGLKRGDIDGAALNIRRAINNLLEQTGGKNQNALRTLVMPPTAAGILDQQADMLRRAGVVSPWLFPDEDGNAMSQRAVYKIWRRYADPLGIRCSPYELRHTMISYAKYKLPKQMLKRYVGHSDSMDTYGTYGHDIEGELEEAAQLLDGVFTELFTK